MLDRRRFLVKERVAIVKLTDAYDIFDPESGQRIGEAVDSPPSLAKYARLFIHKRFLPTRIEIFAEDSSEPVLSLVKKPGFLRVEVQLLDSRGHLFGKFRSKLFRLGGGFLVFDAGDSQVADVNGDWKGWNFKVVSATGRVLAEVTKKWAGLGKEFFTSADTYMISVDETEDEQTVALALAAGLAVDMVFKEA